MAQNKALYTFGKWILFPAYKLLYRFKVKNKGVIPAEGGVILTANHLSFADPVLLGLSEKRRLYFMAKQELFRNKFAGAVIRALGAFPVERGAGDGKAIKTGEEILDAIIDASGVRICADTSSPLSRTICSPLSLKARSTEMAASMSSTSLDATGSTPLRLAARPMAR